MQNNDSDGDLAAVLAAQKRHEAIDADVQAHQERIRIVSALAEQLLQEQYNGADDIADRADVIMGQWNALSDQLQSKRYLLDEAQTLQRAVQHMFEVSTAIKELRDAIQSSSQGKHLAEAEETWQRHSLRTADITTLLDGVYSSSASAQIFVAQGHKLSAILLGQQNQLLQDHTSLVQGAAAFKKKIEDTIRMFTFRRDAEELSTWIKSCAGIVSRFIVLTPECTYLISFYIIHPHASSQQEYWTRCRKQRQSLPEAHSTCSRDQQQRKE